MSNDPIIPIVLCIYGSPRPKGNSDRLMDAFAEGVEAAGGQAERIFLRDLAFSPCREIYACRIAGECALRDDMTPLYDRLRRADAIALATPVMFYGVSALAKAFIDRCQALWSLRYLVGERVSLGPVGRRKGVLLSVGATRGQKVFDGIRLTFRYFLEALEAEPWAEVLVREVDDRGDIDGRPEALAEARQTGARLVGALRAERGTGTHGASR